MFEPLASPRARLLWAGLLVLAASAGSLALACAAPLAAIALLAAAALPPRQAVLTAAIAWAANQAIGFTLLAYPTGFDSLAWGAGIGVATIAATVVAVRVVGPSPLGWVTGFAAAFVVYESVLFLPTLGLGGTGAFAPAAVAEILVLNAVWAAGFAAAYGAKGVLGVERRLQA